MKCFYKGLEDFIPNGMTVVIIDFLEEINVKHHEGYRFVFFLQEVNGVVEFSFNASVIERFWRSICPNCS